MRDNETVHIFMSALMTLGLVLCLYTFYQKYLKPALYWKIRGVYHVNLYHRFYKIFLSRDSFLEVVRDAYESFPDRRYYGSYQVLRPSLFLRDLDLIKKIIVKDYEHFYNHPSFTDRVSDPIVNQNLFSLKGKQWRTMRSTLSPAFTSSKMRQMFVLIAQEAARFTRYYLDELGQKGKLELEMKGSFSKYTNDVISSCAFGIECDSLKNMDNEFFQMGTYFSSRIRGWRALRGLIAVLFPTISRFLGIGIFPRKVTDFFKRIVRETIAYREKEGVVRPDLIHLLVQARNGQLKAGGPSDTETAGFATVLETNATNPEEEGKIELTNDIITAQALVFFIAGFETSSTLLGFTSYALATNPEVQQKLQKEIDESLAKAAGKLDYDVVLNMKYLDQVISETLRMYPPAFAISRVCTKDYLIPAERPNEKDLLIEKGCLVAVPIYGIHMCPDFFPDPGKFDPERFSEENKQNLVPGAYMPFGSGPRNCIGSRFSLLETKALIVSLLSKMTLVPCERTEIPIKFSKTAVLGPKNGIWLALEKRRGIH